MKNNVIILFKILLLNQFKLYEIKDKKSKTRRNTIIVGIAMIVVTIMSAIYSFGIGFGLGSLGIGYVIPGFGIAMVSIITLFFTIFKSNGTLFGFKDYEMLVSLPIKTSTIITSRFLHMYVINTIFAAILMIPLGIAYCIFEKPADSFYLIWTCGILLATLIPTTIATAVGACIVYVASHFKYTNACVTVLSLVLVIGMMSSSMLFGNTPTNSLDNSQLSNLGELISKQSNTIYPISSIFEKAVVDNNLWAFVQFIIISVGWYLLFLKLLTLKYKSINTAIMTHSSKSNYKMQELKISSALFSLYKKELKRFFSSPIYVLNVGMGTIMALIMTIAIFVFEPTKLEEMMKIPNLNLILVKVLPFAFSAVLAMSCTTCVALSLEGKNLWILKSLPVKTKTILNSKILVNLTITIPTALIFGILMNIKFDSDMVTRIMLIVTPIIYSLFVAIWGIFINIKLPNFEWESETAVIKQGMSSMIGMLGGAALAVVPILATLFLTKYSYQMIHVVSTLVFGIISAFLYRNICRYNI